MLDIRYIRANAEKVQESTRQKGYDVDISQLLKLDDDRRALGQRVDDLRERRNQNAAKMKGGKPEQSAIDEGKAIKVELADIEEKLSVLEASVLSIQKTVPNMACHCMLSIIMQKSLGARYFGANIRIWV